MKKIPRATWEGTFTIYGVPLRCAVLDDEAHTRVINGEDVARLFGEMESGSDDALFEPTDLEAFSRWQKGL